MLVHFKKRMKMQKIISSSLLASFLLAGSALAHDLWIGPAKGAKAGEKLHVHFGYGDEFPKTEAIPEDRRVLFDQIPLKITGASGDVAVQTKAGGDNADFESSAPLKDGTYILSGVYNPSYWSKDKDNKWHMLKNKKDLGENAASCQQASMFSKHVLSTGKLDMSLAQKPVGHALEIIPLADVNEVKGSGFLPVQILFEGKPLAHAKIQATFAGFGDKIEVYAHDFPRPQSFVNEADKDGKVNIYTYPGANYYLALVKHEKPFDDKSICDKHTYKASLSFKTK